MKSWSYRQITEKAEPQIKKLMARADSATDYEEKRLYRQWAYGVFLGWSSLTDGWIQDGDLERLENLTKITSETPEEPPELCDGSG